VANRIAIWMVFLVCALGGAAVASAQEVPGGMGWTPAAGAVGDNTYQGFVDQPAAGATVPAGGSFHVSGWVVDMTADGWSGIDGVAVYNGGQLLATGTVGLSRPDVAAVTGNGFWGNAGFDVVVGGLPAGPATLTVVAHTPAKGSWSRPLTVNAAGQGAATTSAAGGSGLVLRLITPGPGETVIANNNGIIRGVAYDTRTRAELGVGVDRVEVFLDGARGTAGSQNLGTATQVGNEWSLAWEPTKFDKVPHHVLWIYARSNVTGEERLLNREIDIEH
jgi:hypothetical protein